MLVIGKMLIERVVKRDNGSKTIEREVRMVAMHAGQVMFVKNILGRTIYDLAWVEVLDDGHCRVEFKEDTIITVEGLHPNGWTCENLRFARLNNWDRTAYKGVKLFHNPTSRPLVDWSKHYFKLIRSHTISSAGRVTMRSRDVTTGTVRGARSSFRFLRSARRTPVCPLKTVPMCLSWRSMRSTMYWPLCRLFNNLL